jgi:short-subunit dehydrogenase
MELHPFGIDVVVIQPGAILTEWNSIARDGLMKYSGNGDYRDGVRSHIKMMASADQGSIPSPPSVVARTIVKAVEARKPKTRYATGGGAKSILFLRRILSDRYFDAIMRVAERQATKSAASGLEQVPKRRRRGVIFRAICGE